MAYNLTFQNLALRTTSDERNLYLYVCLYICLSVFLSVCLSVLYLCMYVCMYLRMYVCMFEFFVMTKCSIQNTNTAGDPCHPLQRIGRNSVG